MKRDLLGGACVGTAFGFALSRIGFSSWDEVHRMFVFADFRLLLVFSGAAAILAVGWLLVRRLSSVPPRWVPRLIHRGSLVGGVAFGAGWAVSGACPSVAFVQLGEGKLAAGFTLAGIFAGNYLYARVHARYFRWSQRSCVDD